MKRRATKATVVLDIRLDASDQRFDRIAREIDRCLDLVDTLHQRITELERWLRPELPLVEGDRGPAPEPPGAPTP